MRLGSVSTTTRILAVLVLAVCVVLSYGSRRLKPAMAEQERLERRLDQRRSDVELALSQVEELRSEHRVAQRWSRYSKVLGEQSAGRSLHELLRACGGGEGPALSVRDLRFARAEGARGFDRLGFAVQVSGEYRELALLLGQLDRVFPPVELSKLALSRSDERVDDGPVGDEAIAVTLEGHVYEP